MEESEEKSKIEEIHEDMLEEKLDLEEESFQEEQSDGQIEQAEQKVGVIPEQEPASQEDASSDEVLEEMPKDDTNA